MYIMHNPNYYNNFITLRLIINEFYKHYPIELIQVILGLINDYKMFCTKKCVFIVNGDNYVIYGSPLPIFNEPNISIFNNGSTLIKTNKEFILNIKSYHDVSITMDTYVTDAIILSKSGIVYSYCNNRILQNDFNFKIKEMSNSDFHCVMISFDDKLYSIGSNCNGKLGINTTDPTPRNKPNIININNIISTSCGSQHSVFLAKNGDVYSCGSNYSHQQGFDDKTSVLIPRQIPISDVVSIKCGSYCSLMLKNDGTVYYCGTIVSTGSSTLVKMNIFNIKEIHCGNFFVILLDKNRKIYSIDDNSVNRLGVNTHNDIDVAQYLKISSFVQKIVCGPDHSIMMTDDGDFYKCGKNIWRGPGLHDYNEIPRRIENVNL